MFRIITAAALALVCGTGMLHAAQQQDGRKTQAAAGESKAAPININNAPASQLQELPGNGAATAQRILDNRETYGGDTNSDSLMHARVNS